MIKKQKIKFFCNIFMILFIFIIIYLFLNKYLNRKSKLKENLENITYLDIIHRLFTSPKQYKVEGRLKNNTYLGGNSGPVVINN